MKYPPITIEWSEKDAAYEARMNTPGCQCLAYGDTPARAAAEVMTAYEAVQESHARHRQPAKLAELLAKHGLIARDAIEDPEGYDAGATLANVTALAAELPTFPPT